MMRKRIRFGACFLLVLLMVCGCGDKSILNLKEIENDTLYVSKEGKLELADVEQFDKSYYSDSELKDFVKETIEDYNTQEEAGKVRLEDFSVKDQVAKVLLSFDSADTYEGFQGEKLKVLTSKEVESNLVLPESFVKATDGSMVGKDEVLAEKDLHYLIVEGVLDIQLDGTIEYYSDASLTGDNLIQTTGEQIAVIIYK